MNPYLVLIFFEERQQFYLYNIGKGTAVDVKINDYYLDVGNKIKFHYTFICTPILKAGERGAVSICNENGEAIPIAGIGFMMPSTGPSAIHLKAQFKDLIGRRHNIRLIAGKGMYSGTLYPQD